MTSSEPGERLVAATAAQLRALGHPTRIRILRLCLDTERTNQQLADALRVAPATVLRHVRRLTETGFLEPGTVRSGRRGALERPYRATRLTCQLALDGVGQPALSTQVHVAVVGAYAAELREAGVAAVHSQLRGRSRLTEASRRELARRVEELLDEYGDRDEAGGAVVSFLWSLNAVPPG